MKGDGETEAREVQGAHPVFLVSTNRRKSERRRGSDRRLEAREYELAPMVMQEEQVVGQGGAMITERRAVVSRPLPPPLVGGPRAAVYIATPGARLRGQTGHAVRVFESIERAGQAGKTANELRKELKLKAKSLESVLYRLKLAGLIRAYSALDVRG